MKALRRIGLAGGLFFFAVAVSAQVPDEARVAYQEARYDAAAAAWQATLHQGGPNPDVYFNLGNCYYRLGRLGQSIACYRAALALDPDDEDAARNLEFVRTRRVDRLVMKRPDLATRAAQSLARHAALLFTIGNYLMVILLAAWILERRHRSISVGIVVGALLFLGGAIGLWCDRREARRELAVITAAKADIYATPQPGVPILTAHDGLEVEVRRREGEYAEVTIGEGTVGWLRNDALVTVPK